MSTYADLEIRIFAATESGYPVELTLDHQQEFTGGHLDLAIRDWVHSADSASDGLALFDMLVADGAIREAWGRVRVTRPRCRIRLRIDPDAPELHAIPWELMRESTADQPVELAAAHATPFSRYLPGKWHPGTAILTRPVRVLVAVANPEGLDQPPHGLTAIDVPREVAALEEATREVCASGALALEVMEGPVSLAALQEELGKGYHVLHFVGHGAYSKKRDEAVLYMADGDGKACRVPAAEVAEMLARQLADVDTSHEDKLRLVVLESCETATRSPADAFRGFAPQLVAAGVPAVVAMQDPVPQDTARAFVGEFYRELLDSGLVDRAANVARSKVIAAGLPGAAIPVLFMRLWGGELLGQRGRLSTSRSEKFWPYLLKNVLRGKCTPFLGPRVTDGVLPSRAGIAEVLAEAYDYPYEGLRDSDLSRVAQYMALQDRGVMQDDYLAALKRGLYRHLDLPIGAAEEDDIEMSSLGELTADLDWASRITRLRETEIHNQLAELPLPLYVTTNVDSFLLEALRAHGREGRRIVPRLGDVDAGTPQFVLEPEPSADNPVILHLDGHADQDEMERDLVLSLDDYLAHFVRISRDQETILPMNVLRMLSQTSFMFLGYSLDDWEFRVVLQGLIANISKARTTGKRHLGVQLEVTDAASPDKAMEYLQQYLGQFDIDIYWGTPQQFIAELHAEYVAYQARRSDRAAA